MPLDKETLQQIRVEAEKIVQSKKLTSSKLSGDELLHEVNVQKIELELQNQQLRETEVKLQESLDLYQKLYHKAPTGYISLDSKGVIKKFNETFANLCKVPPSILRNCYFAELLSKESADIFRHRLRAFFTHPNGKVLTVWLEGGRKSPIHLSIHGERESFDGLLVCNLIDTTSQRKAEDELAEINARFTQLFEHMRSGVAVYRAVENGNDFVFTDFNKAAEKIENIDRHSVLGRKVSAVFPAVRKFGLLNTFKQVWETGVPKEHPVMEYVDDRIQGWRTNYIYRLPTGEIVAIFRDVTRQKQTEAELAKSEERFKIAVNGTQDGLWDLNLLTYEAYLSDRYSTMLGYASQELPENIDTWLELLHPDDKAGAEERLRQYLAKEVEVYNSTFRMRAKNGSYRWINGRGQAIWDESGKPIRIIGFNTDITELVEAKEEIKTLRDILPICMYCKEIRDEQGYWNRLEEYIMKHTSAKFSHGICDKCMTAKFPEQDERIQKKRNKS